MLSIIILWALACLGKTAYAVSNIDNMYVTGGGMFGQNNDHNDLPEDKSADSGFSVPAPGAPAGPVDQTAPTDATSVNPFEPVAADPLPAVPAPVTLGSDDLLTIKQDALHELKPLVGHLEQSAEEKFRTTMMMIQASDDHSLVQAAYDAAKQITDEKARAQALLDVVNEINYFTQQKS